VSSKRALGRGLDTLLPPRSPAPVSAPQPDRGERPPLELPLDSLVPNPFQPRRHFDPQALDELAQSIKADGIIQPLVVRKNGDRYELIAGERRWRAARLADVKQVPVYIQDTPDSRMLEVALIENIQREDLNPMETASAFQRLNHDLSLSHEEIGQRTGKDRATVSNFIRLLQLPAEVQTMIAERKLSPGHARPLLRLTDSHAILDMANRIIENGWSVRQVEMAFAATSPTPKAKKPDVHPIDPNVRAAIDDLERALGTRVRLIERGKGKGRLEIDYFSAEDRDRIYALIVRDQN